MNNKKLQQFINAFDIKNTETVNYQQAFRTVLLSQAHQKQSMFSKITLLISNTINKHMEHKKLIGIGSFAFLAVFAFAVISFNNTPHALAKRLVEKSMTTIEQSAPLEFDKIKQILGSDPLQSLREAKKAKDLKEITKTEFDAIFADKNIAIAGMATATASALKADGTTEPLDLSPSTETQTITGTITGSGPIDMQTVLNSSDLPFSGDQGISRYLSYTDTKGHLTVLGLDEDGAPLFKQLVLNASDIKDLN